MEKVLHEAKVHTSWYHAPLGREVWQDTRLELPELATTLYWHNLFTGEALAPVTCWEDAAFTAAGMLAHFPIALLIGSGKVKELP